MLERDTRDSTTSEGLYWLTNPWVACFCVLGIALLMRTIFFTGFFGSDEVTYTSRAMEITNGNWTSSDYIGATRFGINIPAAFFLWLFGPSEVSANLWSLVCSLGEVALVFVCAYAIWNLRAAIFASLVLALLPLHVHFGGRLDADAPLAFFVTLSFVSFFFAEKKESNASYVLAGVSAGFVFWIKESVTIFAATFFFYAIIMRVFKVRWWLVIFSGFIVVSLNSLLFWILDGDPLHIFKIIFSTTQDKYVGSNRAWIDSPGYYFRYLFLDGRHTWMAPFLTLGGIWLWFRQVRHGRQKVLDTEFVVVWAVGLFVVFTFMVISISPLKFIPKQTNYMLIFMAPFAMLAGYFLSSLKGLTLRLTVVALVLGSFVLSGLEQQAIRVFVSNTKAAVAFAQRHADVPIFGSEHNVRGAIFSGMIQGDDMLRRAIKPLSELSSAVTARLPEIKTEGNAAPLAAYVILDRETMNWGPGRVRIDSIPPCWQVVERLDPRGFGFGERILTAIKMALEWIPGSIGEKLGTYTDSLLRPKPADVYAIPYGCRVPL